VTIRPIKTERDYRKALKEIEKLWDAKQNTPKGDRLDVLVTLVEADEQRCYKIEPPDPVEAIKFPWNSLGSSRRTSPKFSGVEAAFRKFSIRKESSRLI
jgi:HTH-type transcriptional regulator/antitoxin HigA